MLKSDGHGAMIVTRLKAGVSSQIPADNNQGARTVIVKSRDFASGLHLMDHPLSTRN